MDRDRIEGNWNQIKGQLRETYGDLTDDDIEEAKGEREQMIGALQAKVGKDKEEVRRDVDRILGNI